MFKRFLQLEWKAFFRSASLGKSIGLKILMGFLAIYFMSSFLILGIALYPMLKELFPNQKPMEALNNFVAIWIVAELLGRFILQTLPVLNIKPLMINNVKRKTIIHFVLLKSIFSFYNTLAPLAIIPFGIWCITQGDYSTVQIIGWMIAMLSIILAINYANFLIKKRFSDNIKAFLPYIAIAAILVGLEYFEVFKTSELIGSTMNFLLENPFLAIVPILIAIGLYSWNFNYLKNNFYLDASLKGKSTQAGSADLSWTKKFGNIAPFLQNDLKLLWRNKRPKSTIWMCLLFAAYGLFFYTQTIFLESSVTPVFVGIFITGIFVINFGQFIPAWDSSYYSMLMSQNVSMKQYLDSKAGLMYFSIVIMSILTTPYLYFGVNILLIHLACAIYNAGINVPLILYAGSFNKKRIDMEKTPFMNYQGTGATQWILGFPLLLLPLLIFIIINWIFEWQIATITIAVIGVMGLLLKNMFMTQIVAAYKTRKHAMIAGFKQQES